MKFPERTERSRSWPFCVITGTFRVLIYGNSAFCERLGHLRSFGQPEVASTAVHVRMCPQEKFINFADASSLVHVAGEADAAPIAAVTNAAFAIETFLEGMRTDAGRVLEMMRHGVFLVYAARHAQLAASVYVETRGTRGYFGMLAVDPLYQGKGIGARMVQAAESYCRERGCRAMDITVLSLRPELLPFYHRLGYDEMGTEDFRPSRSLKPGATCHSILMSKNL